MKLLYPIKLILTLVLGASLFTACDKYDDDINPSNRNNLIVNNDYVTTQKNKGVLINVLANDTIGGPANVQFTPPGNGTLQPDSTTHGSLYYTPNQNFTGTDYFTYKVCMGAKCATAQVTIVVKPDSTGPPFCTLVAVSDSITLTHIPNDSSSVIINVLANDIYCNTGSIPVPKVLVQPAAGYITTSGNGTNFRFIYNTNAPYTNTRDIFKYSICQVVNGQQYCSDTYVIIKLR